MTSKELKCGYITLSRDSGQSSEKRVYVSMENKTASFQLRYFVLQGLRVSTRLHGAFPFNFRRFERWRVSFESKSDGTRKAQAEET